MLLQKVDVGTEDAAQAGNNAHLGHRQEEERRVVLQEAQPLADGMEEQGLQMILGTLWNVPRQAVQPGFDKRLPAKIHWILREAQVHV